MAYQYHEHPYLPAKYMEHISHHWLRRVETPVDGGSVKPIGLAEYKDSSMNSFERQFLMPFFSDEVLIHMVENARGNAAPLSHAGSYGIPGTYDEAIIHLYSKELCARLAAVMNRDILDDSDLHGPAPHEP